MKIDKNFYRSFEDKYRGSRELIKSRVSTYLPFALLLKELYSDSMVVDLGCGRGEWLELLGENAIEAKGVDSDDEMLRVCQKYNLDVEKNSAVVFLKEQTSQSLMMISALHVVEHISFEELNTLIKESLRVLKPGGILILETPNPENIRVSTESFYIDPTHIKPIPSALLSYLTDFYGYAKTRIFKLQESKKLQEQEIVTILELLEGVSPDYAIIAQKEASSDILEKFENIFAQKKGLSLKTLCEKFENRFLKMDKETRALRENLKEIDLRLQNITKETLKIQKEYSLMLNSNSWRLTKPLRILRKILKP